MKKVLGLFVVIFLVISSIPFVLVQEEIVPGVQENLLPPPADGSGARTNFDVLAEKIGAVNIDFNNLALQVNFSRILLGILLWMVLFSVFKSMNIFDQQHRSALWSGFAALIVTILAFIYLPPQLLSAIGVEYGALGATVLTVIPFAIAIYFTVWVSPNLAVARAIWLVFFLYYIVILLNQPAVSSNFDIASGNTWFFIIACAASLILFIFMGPIRAIWWQQHVQSVEERINRNIGEFGLGLRAGRNVGREAQRS
ncbi:hypothetical protein J4456_04020 [Candidatus Pacearchaeota archaeon]|nr:hypothetical protein [Candidatus Pacearchaeota archaeon]